MSLPGNPLVGQWTGLGQVAYGSHDGPITSENRSPRERSFNMAGLPEGLVTNSETITSTIESIHHVAVEDVITLWKGTPVLVCYLVEARTERATPSILCQQVSARGRGWSTAGKLLLEDMGQSRYIEYNHR